MQTASLALAVSLVMAVPTGIASANAAGTDAASQEFCERQVKGLERTLGADPLEQAARSISEGDLKYLGVYGYTTIFPGVENTACVKQNNLGKVIEGTGDALCSGQHMKLQVKAGSFARAYNATIAAERSKRQLIVCR